MKIHETFNIYFVLISLKRGGINLASINSGAYPLRRLQSIFIKNFDFYNTKKGREGENIYLFTFASTENEPYIQVSSHIFENKLDKKPHSYNNTKVEGLLFTLLTLFICNMTYI